jgi:hypothetical protein
VTLDERVVVAVADHPKVSGFELVGSRAEGRATELSDWDFRVDTDEFAAVAAALPGLVAPLEPLAAQWDRLSAYWCYMLIVAGPAKVDLIFANEPHTDEPPWRPSRDNLAELDAHFWDWMLWLNAKEAAGKLDRVAVELEKLTVHLLEPLGVERVPSSVADAVARYRTARARAERELGVTVARRLEQAVVPALRSR